MHTPRKIGPYTRRSKDKNRPEGRPLHKREKPKRTGRSACATNGKRNPRADRLRRRSHTRRRRLRTDLKIGHYIRREKARSTVRSDCATKPYV